MKLKVYFSFLFTLVFFVSYSYGFTISSVGGTVSSSHTICYNTLPNDLSLTGQVGTVLFWQRDTNSSFTAPTTISSSSSLTTLLGSLVGSLTDTVYIRAVVQNGASPIAYSSFVTITVTAPPAGDGYTYGSGSWIGYYFSKTR
jgi:hypothetical protein